MAGINFSFPPGWSLTGNFGTSSALNFIGTKDAADVVIKRNDNQVAKFNGTAVNIGSATTSATGTNAIAIGSGAISTTGGGVALGNVSNCSGGHLSIGEATTATGFAAVTVGLYSQNNAIQSVLLGRGDIDTPATYGLLLSGYGARVREQRGIALGALTNVQHAGACLLWDQGDFSTFYASDAANQFKSQFRGGFKFQTGTVAAPITQFEILASGKIKMYNVPTYADNAAAIAAGETSGTIYKTATGQINIVY